MVYEVVKARTNTPPGNSISKVAVVVRANLVDVVGFGLPADEASETGTNEVDEEFIEPIPHQDRQTSSSNDKTSAGSHPPYGKPFQPEYLTSPAFMQ